MNSKTFCILPWIHIYANPDGSVIPCCIADHHLHLGNVRNNNIEEIWNNDNYKNLRKKMLAGERSNECKACYHAEDSGNVSSRQHWNLAYADYFYLLNHTNNDGSLNKIDLAYFDVRWSNICNFKCRSCSGTYSSSWATEDNKHGRNRDVFIFAGGNNNDNLYNQFVPYLKGMREIYFAGGEPLLTDKHYDMLDYFLENKHVNVNLRYNTNLSTLLYKGKSIIDYWKNFQNVNVYVSLDSWGQRAEYIREGTNWEEIVDNIKLIKSELPHVRLQTHTVISCFNVFTYVEFLEYLFQNSIFDLETYNPTTYNLINPNEYSFQIINSAFKDKIIDKLQSKKFNKSINSQIKNIVSALENSSHNIELQKGFKKITEYYDNIRNRDFLQTFPELHELYTFKV